MKTNIIQNITGGLVVIVAILFAGMLTFNDILPYLNGWKRIATIVVLVLYASYRFSRIYTDLKKDKHQNERS
jgi:type IV secretory pathway VirB2 component (pilin)